MIRLQNSDSEGQNLNTYKMNFIKIYNYNELIIKQMRSNEVMLNDSLIWGLVYNKIQYNEGVICTDQSTP